VGPRIESPVRRPVLIVQHGCDLAKKGKDLDAVKEISLDNIGIKARNLSSSELNELKIKNGVLVTNVTEFSKAYNQRVREGNVIVSADHKEVNMVSELKSIIENKKGQAILLRLVDKEGNSRLVGIDIPN